MTKTQSGEQESTNQAKPDVSLLDAAEAVRLVKAAIAAEEKRLEKIASETEQSPVMLEGETSAGYIVQMMLDPAKVARVMLDYDYPTYRILMEDAPQAMWSDLARMVGLESVYSVDL